MNSTQTKISQAERMRQRRANMTDEQKEAQRKKDRERMRKKRNKPTPESRRKITNERLLKYLYLKGIEITDANKVIEYLNSKYTNKNTIRTYLANLIGWKRTDASFPSDQLDIYRTHMLTLIKAIKIEAEKNKKSDRDLKNWVSYSDLQKAHERCKQKGTLLEKVIFSLYMDVPPRRGEWRTVQVISEDTRTKRGGNYAILSNSKMEYCNPNTLLYFILGEYKTAKKYGDHLILGNSFDECVAEYVASRKDDFLFEKKYRSASGWTKLLNRVTEKYTGKKVSVNLFRKAFITSLEDKKITTKQRKEIALDMGTSVEMTYSNYRKVD
jgi:hypothetical protein